MRVTPRLYGNAQAMVNLFNMNFILPLRVGVMGIADVGRVFAKGETSTKWHPGYGIGIFVRVPATQAVFHGSMVHGSEGNHFYVNIGFGI